MQEQTVNPTLGWSWSGLALGPIALIKHGLWRVFLISVGCLLTIFAIATAAAHLPQVPMSRELLPITVIVVLIAYHLLVASSLSRWRMHRYLHERLARQGGSVASTGIAGQRLQSDLELMRHRADTTLETGDTDAVHPQLLATSTPLDTALQTAFGSATAEVPGMETTTTATGNQIDPSVRDDFENIPDHFFAQALDELQVSNTSDSGRRDETAWHQATTIHGDNLDLARSFYIRIRVRQLMDSNPQANDANTAGRSMQRANSRRMARLRAYESYIENIFTDADPKPVSTTPDRHKAVDSDLLYRQDHSTLTISEINALMAGAGLSLSTTQANSYVVQNTKQDAMEINSHQELEQFLQILAQKMAKSSVDRSARQTSGFRRN